MRNEYELDIIIPTYNNSEYTIRCLRSIKKNTVVSYRIIWIDDGSIISEYQKVSNELDEWRIGCVKHRTEKNGGFAKAVNIGIEASESDPIILLNNDVIVTKGWLRRLIHGFGINKKAGIIGAITDKCDSKQRYGRLMRQLGRSIPKKPAEYFRNLKSEIIPTTSISYFCVAISRKLINTIGILDENFMNGGEDNDFNERARLAGFRMFIALDCFVWHRHNATRGKFTNMKKALIRNRAILSRKRAERKKNENIDCAI